MVVRRWPADGTSLELRTEIQSMVFYRSHGRRCFVDAVVDVTLWSVGATVVFAA